MSVRLMSKVWELDIGHPQQSVLMVLADHADDNGEQLFPSQAFIAWKTGYSERQVRRVMKELREAGAVGALTKPSPGRSIRYRLNLSVMPMKEPFEREPAYGNGGQDDRRTTTEPEGERRPQEVVTAATQGRHAGQGGSSRRPQLRPPNHQNHQEPPEPPSSAIEVAEPDSSLAMPSVQDRLFDEWWAIYPRKDSKIAARKSFGKVLKAKLVTPPELFDGARRYRDDPNREDEFTRLPTTWLNQGSWGDGPLPARKGKKGVTAQELAQRAMDDRQDESGPIGVAGFVGAAMAAVGGQDEEVGSRSLGGHDSSGIPEPGDA